MRFKEFLQEDIKWNVETAKRFARILHSKEQGEKFDFDGEEFELKGKETPHEAKAEVTALFFWSNRPSKYPGFSHVRRGRVLYYNGNAYELNVKNDDDIMNVIIDPKTWIFEKLNLKSFDNESVMKKLLELYKQVADGWLTKKRFIEVLKIAKLAGLNDAELQTISKHVRLPTKSKS